ncbi:hypothetical protein PAMA_016567 [Pampus argenteus]
MIQEGTGIPKQKGKLPKGKQRDDYACTAQEYCEQENHDLRAPDRIAILPTSPKGSSSVPLHLDRCGGGEEPTALLYQVTMCDESEALSRSEQKAVKL